jgi:hypothetical protein
MRPGDTKGDTNLSTVFVSTQPMTAHASSRANNLPLQLGEDYDGTVALFVSGLRRARLGQFLEVRIIPQRIEHWIEPE